MRIGLDQVVLWDVAERDQPRRNGRSIPLPIGSYGLAWSPDSRTLAVDDTDNSVALGDFTERIDLKEHSTCP
ncbi:hypothetical protein ACFV4N_14865 [Actinosynnema sp. NPDC059797]